MTIFEHAALGATLALAIRAQRRAGWAIVGMAAVAGALADWDGLSLLFGQAAFARVHRVWGHNLLVAGVSGAFVGGLGYLWRQSLSAQKLARRFWPEPIAVEQPAFAPRQLALWIVMGVLASLSHLASDIVFSGHPDMRSWPVPIYWPFSEDGWVWPLVAWGDPVPTLIFVVAMFALFRWRTHGQAVALATLLCVHGYLVIRWLTGGVGP